jgi:DNA-binding NtrC family response regulator
MASVLRDLGRVAPSRLPVLVLGPTGSGKELAARELHRLSGRAGPLVAVNASAFSETLMESEVFGHVQGAFTGALRDRRGAIEAAEGGTLFLDEVAELSPRLQVLFLRVLQEREVRRVGSERAQQVDVRFVAATHRSLEALVAGGSFRQDLLFRLQGAEVSLPSLGERRHEFPFLLPQLVARVAAEGGLAEAALELGLAEALGALPWPGNVRELLHALERALLRRQGATLGVAHFPELERATMPMPGSTWAEATRRFQREFLLETLRRHGFRFAEAARALGLARPALYATARRLGIYVAQARRNDGTS